MPSPLINSGSSPALTARLQLQHRLVAVWALAEGFMGGILHGLHLPVTGLIIGSISVCCLALLSKVTNQRGDFLKATLIVLLVKAMLSPHSPPMAYFAVFSQGLLAEVLFNSSKRYKLNCFLLAIITQLQSAIQHLIVVVIVFGLDFWRAVDQYLNKIMATLGLTGVSYALYLAGAYVFLHLLTGIYTGWLAGKLPEWLRRHAKPTGITWDAEANEKAILIKPERPKNKRRFSLSFLFVWILLAAVFLQSYFGLGPEILPKAKAFQIIIRSVLIVSVWYFVVSPFLLNWFHKWLAKQKGPLQMQLQAVLNLLPETQAIIRDSWKNSSGAGSIKKMRNFIADAGSKLFALPE